MSLDKMAEVNDPLMPGSGVKNSAILEINDQGFKTKPSREIYKPPNLRKSRTYEYHFNAGNNGRPNGHGNSGHRIHYYQSQQQPHHGMSRGGVTFDPNHVNESNNAQFNLYTKPFRNQTPKRNWNLYQSDASPKNDAFPFVQSKSANSLYAHFQKHIRQLEEAEKQNGGSTNGKPQEEHLANESGATAKGRVRFSLDDQSGNGPLERQFKALNIEAPNSGPVSFRTGENPVRKPELFRSKSMLYRNEAAVGGVASPAFNRKLWEAFHTESNQSRSSDWPPTKGRKNSNNAEGVKRSKSFGSRAGHQVTYLATPPMAPPTPNWDDFQLDKWPKGVVESVMVAINGVERVPARHKIDMVTRLFGTLLGDYGSNLTSGREENQNLANLVLPAISIFTYFIQRESDDTVYESFLNNALMTYQGLSQGSKVKTPITSKWTVFIQLLSTFYQKTKGIRMHGKRFEEFSRRLLSLLCDASLAILRMSNGSYTAELVDLLFGVMTSLGRDMETKYPAKMKEILAGVRDVLLGVTAPAQEGPSAHVQKTLMQLIELHAANWQLPASAVRYYYANSGKAN